MNLEPNLHIDTTDARLAQLCEAYWKISPQQEIPFYRFSYSVKELASYFGFDDSREVSQVVAKVCKGEIPCTICATELQFSYRSHYSNHFDLNAMQGDGGLKGPICMTCRKSLYEGERYLKRLFYDPMQELYFKALQRLYPIVFPQIPLSSILKQEGIMHLFNYRPYFNKEYYLQATISYVIYEGKSFQPLLAIDYDHSPMGKDDYKIAFKRAAFKEVNVPYYFLPKEVDKVFQGEHMLILEELFSELFASKRETTPLENSSLADSDPQQGNLHQ